jgi:GT2 family glycosyltransferase
MYSVPSPVEGHLAHSDEATPSAARAGQVTLEHSAVASDLRGVVGVDPIVTVVIPTYNGKRWLRDCVQSVVDSNYPPELLEIIIVDNGSTDGSIEELLRDLASRARLGIRVIRNSENLGWSPANNQGFQDAHGSILISLSNDVRPDPEWLREIVAIFAENPRVGLVQCLCLSLRDRTTLDSGLAFIDRFGFLYGYQPTPGVRTEDTFYAEGAAFAFTRRVYEDVGELDGDFFMQYDDLDFAWRARLRGFEVRLASRSVVYHARGGTVGGGMFEAWPRMIQLVTRNHLVSLYKNLDSPNLIIALPTAASIHLLKGFAFLVMGQRSRALAVLRGVAGFILEVDRARPKRRMIQGNRVVSDSIVLLSGHRFSPKLLIRFMQSQRTGDRPFPPKSEMPSRVHTQL